MEILSQLASISGSIVTIVALLTLIIKPVREKIIEFTKIKTQGGQIEEDMAYVKDTLDQLMINSKNHETKLQMLEEKILDNEASRLKSELFACGDRCRRGIPLHVEEMDHIREIWSRYHDELKRNGSGELEMKFITEYYNKQNISKDNI